MEGLSKKRKGLMDMGNCVVTAGRRGLNGNGKQYNKKLLEYRAGWCGSVVDCQPENQRVEGSIPSLGHMLGLWECERQPHIDVSLPLFFPPYPSLKINK